MDNYPLARVSLKNPKAGPGYTDPDVFRAMQNTTARNWLTRLKRVRLKTMLPYSVLGRLQGGLAQPHQFR